MLDTTTPSRRILAFEARFGWAELIALAALSVAILPYFSDPLQKYKDSAPKLLVLKAEPVQQSGGANRSFELFIENEGAYPIENLQIAYNLILIERSPTIDDVEVRLSPPLQQRRELIGNMARATITSPIPPRSRLHILIRGRPTEIHLVTDRGNTMFVSTQSPVRTIGN